MATTDRPTGAQLRRFLKRNDLSRRRAAELAECAKLTMDRYCLPDGRMPAVRWALLKSRVNGGMI